MNNDCVSFRFDLVPELFRRSLTMVLCPIAIAAGCNRCPAFSLCPLKSVIGDYKKPAEPPSDATVKKPDAAPKR